MQYIMFVLGFVLAVFIIRAGRNLSIFKNRNKYMTAVLLSLLAAMVLEIFTFNFVSYETNDGEQYTVHFNTTTKESSVEKEGKTELSSSDGLNLNVFYGDEKITYEAEIPVNARLKDLDVEADTVAKTTEFQIYYMDDAVQSGYKKANIDNLTLVKGLSSSGHVKPHFAGETKNIKLIFTSDITSPISNIRVKINTPVDFNFHVFRFLFVFLIIMFGFVLRYTKDSTTMKKQIFIALLALQSAFIIFLFVATNATFDSNGKYTGVDFYEAIDPYQELTLALAEGKTDLNGVNTVSIEQEQQEIEKLENLENPYEWGQRDGINYKWDRAFYNGKYYCYFGIVPVLFIYLPVYLLTGVLVNTKILTLMLVLLASVLMAKLVLTIAHKWKTPMNMWVTLGTAFSFINASMLLYCINGSKFYEIAAVSALICALAGIDFILNAFVEKGIKKKYLAAGALFMALAVGCRPNYALASFIIAPVVLNGLAGNGSPDRKTGNKIVSYIKSVFCKNNVQAMITFAVPYIIIGLGLMYYNYIRFDSVLEFGAKYQLTVYDTSYYHVTDFGKIPITLLQGIFMPAGISSVFPYFSAVKESANYVGYFYDISYLGILASPVMWLIFLLPWALKRDIKKIGHRGFVIVATTVAVVMCYMTTVMGGTSLRYSVDFAWIFFVPVIYVIFTIYSRARERKLGRYAMIGLGMFMAATIIITTLVSISPSWSTLSEHTPEIFYRLEEMVVFWK